MNTPQDWHTFETRRRFFARGRNVVGYAALTSLLGEALTGRANAGHGQVTTHFPAKAKRVIYLHMVGGPSQMDLFDYKPEMAKWYDKDLPESIRQGQRLTTMTSGQARFPIAPSKFSFERRGQCGMWMNADLLPHLGKVADDICWMR
ncbi:MAG TPA: sulfatase, partial [Verrucomicrobiales bacterium]|nr:sulfatase [Verrucomicrobiales bacterium]